MSKTTNVQTTNTSNKPLKLIVVGNGMVGHKFIENVVNHPDHEHYQVITFSEEPAP